MKSSWCKSRPAKAVARRSVASVATYRVTGGCEAYIVSKRAVRVQPRNWPDGDADVFLVAEGSIHHNVKASCGGVTGVASPGHAYKGISRESRRALYFFVQLGIGAAQSNSTGSLRWE